MSKMNFEKFYKAAHNVLRTRKNNNYIFVYPEFIKYFRQLKEIDKHNFIIGTHFIYGWMPTMLTIHQIEEDGVIDHAVTILNEVKHGKEIEMDELQYLKKIINNSIVGPSKLLHFIAPVRYAIWDSKVCHFMYGDKNVKSIERFFEYTKNVREIAAEERFKQLYPDICNKIGYEVTPLRAIEWIMWMRGG